MKSLPFSGAWVYPVFHAQPQFYPFMVIPLCQLLDWVSRINTESQPSAFELKSLGLGGNPLAWSHRHSQGLERQRQHSRRWVCYWCVCVFEGVCGEIRLNLSISRVDVAELYLTVAVCCQVHSLWLSQLVHLNGHTLLTLPPHASLSLTLVPQSIPFKAFKLVYMNKFYTMYELIGFDELF